ncbi:DUF4157 domain-containing protein [Actinoplanes sp. CA-030573]|uniref:eCIS core domain-containing protein n=1 Tax=Actinoplanes sp. CA-030573 TaxID=3239898 RepID=UPI003D8B7DBE
MALLAAAARARPALGAVWQRAGAGRPLAPDVRAPLERAMGSDFSGVRVHDDRPAQAVLRDGRARAMTIGSHVLLPPGVARGARPGDRALLAHELTHVVQQRSGGPAPADRRTAIEAEARQVASAVAGGTPRVAGGTPGIAHGTPGIAVRLGTSVGPAMQAEAEPAAEESFEREAERDAEREAEALRDPRTAWRDGLPPRVFEEVEEEWRERRPEPEPAGNPAEPLPGRPEPPVVEERGPLLRELIGSALPPWVGRARIELERPIATLERGGTPPFFISSLPERTHYFRWGDGRVPVTYRPRRLHVLDAIAWATPRAPTNRAAHRILEQYLGAWPSDEVIEPLIPSMPPFFPPDLDPDGEIRRRAYEDALAAGKKPDTGADKQPGTATAVEPGGTGRERKRRRPATMRHQIQRGVEYHYSSEDVTAADPAKGVTALQLRAAMATNYRRYMRIAAGTEQPRAGWVRGPSEWGPPIVGGIVHQSKAIGEIVRRGGIQDGENLTALQARFFARAPYNQAPLKGVDDSDTVVRLDIESQGDNLRYES